MKFSKQISRIFVFLFLLSGIACQKPDRNEGKDYSGDWITVVGEKSLTFEASGGEQVIGFSIGKVPTESNLVSSVSPEGEDWCTVTLSENNAVIKTEANYASPSRYTTVTLLFDSDHKVDISIMQKGATDTEDKLIPVISGSPSDGMDSDHLIEKSFDGNKTTYFNSPIGAVSYPYLLTYNLEPGHTLDKIVYTPRTDSGNKWGSFDEFSVEICTGDSPDKFKTIGTFKRGDGVHIPFTIDGINETDVHSVRFTITKSYMDRVSCAEMEFFEEGKNKFKAEMVFEDKACTRLKNGVTAKQLKQIPSEAVRVAAIEMLDGTYDGKWRISDYRPWQDPSVMAAVNRTAKYSLRDNPTGIYFTAGEKVAVAVGQIYEGGDISLLVQDLSEGYSNTKTYSLREGLNEFISEISGLVYVFNHTKDDLPLSLEEATPEQIDAIEKKTVTIHFLRGKQQGYFDSQKHNPSEWPAIRDDAKYRDIDILGKYAHVTWKVADYKSYSTDIVQMIEDMDKLVLTEWDVMGLLKYGKTFRNRIHAAIDYQASSPNAADYRTVYTPSYANAFCSHDSFLKRLWVQSHEIGHVNQVRPGMKWAGMTEVTNNLYCLYVQEAFGVPCKLQADGITGSNVPEDKNWYVNAIDSIVVAGRPHCQPNSSSNINRELQLVPFWQLKLYIEDVLGQKDFYRDLFEHYRVAPILETGDLTEGLLQLDFVRQVCRISGLDLTDFFLKWGFLTPVDTFLNDYSNKRFVITQAQVDDLIAEIKSAGYLSPHEDLYKITDSSKELYR